MLGFVNAPVQWGGITWSAYVWQTILKDDQGERGRLFMHELFHRIQPGLGLMAPGLAKPWRTIHLDSLEGRYWMRLEWRALARALGASGAARTSAIADALAFRAARHQRFPGAAAAEHVVDINEGIATYTQYVTGSDSARTRAGTPGPPCRSRDGYVLRPDVRVCVWSRLRAVARRVVSRLASEDHRASDFGQLLSAAAGVTAAPDAAAAAARYDGASLRAAEEQRDREQQAIIAELRRRYVDGPVLIVPRAGSGSVNNTGATVIPGAGTVFRAMANKARGDSSTQQEPAQFTAESADMIELQVTDGDVVAVDTLCGNGRHPLRPLTTRAIPSPP